MRIRLRDRGEIFEVEVEDAVLQGLLDSTPPGAPFDATLLRHLARALQDAGEHDDALAALAHELSSGLAPLLH